MRSLLAACALTCVAAAAVAAESTTIYRRVGPDGVVTFSDEPSEGAQAVEIVVDRPHEEDVARTQSMHEQQLEMGQLLEESRRADEDARAQQRELDIERARAEAARAAAEASAAYDDDDEGYIWGPWYGPGYPSWRPDDGRPGPGPGPRPPHPPKPRPSPVPPQPLMGTKPH